MELVIHGTKGGYKILYSTPNIPQTVARDVRPDTSSEKAVGQSAYSLSLITEGRIYTKYAIIRDMLRGMYTGNIAFSLFLPNNENLAGAKIKSLLDEISGWYSKYIPDHNLKNVHEDWSVIDGILNKYKSLLVHKEIEPLQAGAKDAVFVYYSSDEELHKYFDSAHCQEEYTEYKQVFFVSKNMENKPQNPIYALRHSENVPIKIDLENIFYKLNGFNGTGDNGIVIEIRNGKGQLLHDKDKIYKKDFISLRYSKKYFKEINLRGRPDDESIKKYLIIDEGNKKITLKKNIELEAERKTVLFFAQDNKGNLVSNVEISCRTNYLPEKIAINNEITFSGEEIGQAWQVSTKGITENMLFYKIIITPENRNEPVRITLIKRKVVKVIAIDKETHYYICDFSIRTKGYWENKPELTFENDEIERYWNIEVSTKDGYYGKIENYCPATGENPLYLELEPQPKESKTKKTNSFVKRHPKLIVFIITVLIFAIVGAWLWNSSLKTEKQKQAFIKQIKEYVEG
ncbi:MAG: hypothetical protein LBF59_02755, partial [Prevotellaceae bacterium]|nr:hypothetical protein [Prevotellaceae bacterium]